MRYSGLTLMFLAARTATFGFLVGKLGNGIALLGNNVMFWLCQLALALIPVVALTFVPSYLLLFRGPRLLDAATVAVPGAGNVITAWRACRPAGRERWSR
jgi:hypothetical protein